VRHLSPTWAINLEDCNIPSYLDYLAYLDKHFRIPWLKLIASISTSSSSVRILAALRSERAILSLCPQLFRLGILGFSESRPVLSTAQIRFLSSMMFVMSNLVVNVFLAEEKSDFNV